MSSFGGKSVLNRTTDKFKQNNREWFIFQNFKTKNKPNKTPLKSKNNNPCRIIASIDPLSSDEKQKKLAFQKAKIIILCVLYDDCL